MEAVALLSTIAITLISYIWSGQQEIDLDDGVRFTHLGPFIIYLEDEED